jgi:hypothetical protein
MGSMGLAGPECCHGASVIDAHKLINATKAPTASTSANSVVVNHFTVSPLTPLGLGPAYPREVSAAAAPTAVGVGPNWTAPARAATLAATLTTGRSSTTVARVVALTATGSSVAWAAGSIGVRARATTRAIPRPAAPAASSRLATTRLIGGIGICWVGFLQHHGVVHRAAADLHVGGVAFVVASLNHQNVGASRHIFDPELIALDLTAECRTHGSARVFSSGIP